MDHLEEFKKQKNVTDKVFSELFGFGKKDNYIKNPLFFEKDGIYYFGYGKSTAESISWPATKEYLEEFDWLGSKLKFVVSPETEFHAKLINFDLDKQIVTFFEGDWKSGGFLGTRFVGVFSGDYFKGDFVGQNSNYKSHPTTFIDGTIYNSSSGILGLKNTISYTGDKFNIITVPVDYIIQFRTRNGIDSSIKVLKRLDGNNSQFKYQVVNGFNNTTTVKDVEWLEIRNGWNTGIYDVDISSKNIANLIEIPSGDAIVELYVSKFKSTFTATPANIPATEKFEPGKLYQFDLKNIPGLNIKSLRDNKGRLIGNAKTVVNLMFSSEQEFNEYQNILNSIKSGQFAQDIKNINRAIRYEEINGYGPYVYLKKIFNNVQGNLSEANKSRPIGQMQPNLGVSSIRKVGSHLAQKSGSNKKNKNQKLQQTQKHDSVYDSMFRVNNFVKFFVDNISTKLGKPHGGAKKFIFDKLKDALGTDLLIANKEQQVQPSQPGQSVDPNYINQFKLKEQVRKIMNKYF
jgi:hypothetical protein